MLIKYRIVTILSVFIGLHLFSCQFANNSADHMATDSQTYDITDTGTFEGGTETDTNPPQTQEVPGVSPPDAATVSFECEVLPENNNSEEIQTYVHFVDHEYTQTTWDIVIYANENVKSFSYIELDETDELIVGKTLYTHYPWEHEYPLLLHTYISDTTLNRGISCVNIYGKVIYMGFFSPMTDESDTDLYLREITIGLIPIGSFEPQITDISSQPKDNRFFDDYFNKYIRNSNKTTWSYMGVSDGKYKNSASNEYMQLDIYRVEHTYGYWIEYYAVPSDGSSEVVYQFQYDSSIVPVWLNYKS